MEDSIFTKIIAGEIPCHKIYEDEHTLAFLDIHPKNEGHTLVIPKHGAEFVWDLPDESYDSLMRTVKKVALHLRQTMPFEHVHEAVVGIDVPYAHVHLIPFNTTDDLHGEAPNEPDHDALAALAERLRFSD